MSAFHRFVFTFVRSSTLQWVADNANALELPQIPSLALEALMLVASTAENKARREHWRCVIAVVDNAGLLLLMLRMDNAAVPGGVEPAPGKARAAAVFRPPSGNVINGNRNVIAATQCFVFMYGGLPVSVDTPLHEEVIALSGVVAWKVDIAQYQHQRLPPSFQVMIHNNGCKLSSSRI